MTRWKKVFRDLWNNRSRSIMVILSIAAGVFAIGMIASTQKLLRESLHAQYINLRPGDAILQTEPLLDDDFVTSIRNMRNVQDAEGRNSTAMRISLDGKGETWRDLSLYALADYTDQRLFLVNLDNGSAPPEKGEVLLERATMAYMGAEVGDEILVKTSAGKKYTLTVTGSAHDLYRIPPILEGWIYGYVSQETLRWMGEADGYNEIYVDATGDSAEEIRSVADEVADRIEGEYLPVYQKTLPNKSEHPLNYIITTVLILLGLVAVLSMILSVLLVVNIISALIAQQERQIGIMKAVGAKSGQILGLYFSMILILGLSACCIAVPASFLATKYLTAYVAELINFDPPQVEFQVQALLFQFGVGLLLPLIAAAPVIINGTRVSPARVLSEYGINQVWGGAGLIDRLLRLFPRMPRDTLLALRNPFRKRGRLILSLLTLTCAGAIFMAIVNLQDSLNNTLNDIFDFWCYDAWVVVDGYVPSERLVSEAADIDGVDKVETWAFTIGRYVRPDGSESDNLYLLAPPAGTQMLKPVIVEGRLLHPGETDAVLVTPGLLSREPTLKVGGTMNLKIEGYEQVYNIVGSVNMIGNSSIGYFTMIDYTAYARQVREPNRANATILNFTTDDPDNQDRILKQVEEAYDRADIDVVYTFLVNDERTEIDSAFAIIIVLLMIMTVILATIGCLGLMGSMSLNVIERTREIGVMRAYGASNRTVFRIVIIEGLVIGLISWFLAIFLAIPISTYLAQTIGIAFMSTPLPATYSPTGVWSWVILVIVISVIASFFPALRATRLTVTEVLAYE